MVELRGIQPAGTDNQRLRLTAPAAFPVPEHQLGCRPPTLVEGRNGFLGRDGQSIVRADRWRTTVTESGKGDP